jgi:uroporphyrinogen decarboxylase
MIMIDFQEKDSMSPPERMMALFSNQPMDRVPFEPISLGFSASICGLDRGEFYCDPDKAFQAGLNLMQKYPWLNCAPTYGYADMGAWEFGGEITWPTDGRYAAPLSHDPVISSPDEIDSLPDPDPRTDGFAPKLHRFNELKRNMGFPASVFCVSATELTAGIIGRETYLKWIFKYPEAVHKVQRKVTDFIKRFAEVVFETHGVENCSCFAGTPSDSNQLVSPKVVAEFSMPYISEVLEFYTSAGMPPILVHLCGDHNGNLDLWKDVPVPPRSIWSFGYEVELEKASQFLGEQFILAGNMKSAVIQMGSREEIKAETRRCLEIGMKHPGGYILMPSCEFPPDTPEENLEAIGEAIFESGYY